MTETGKLRRAWRNLLAGVSTTLQTLVFMNCDLGSDMGFPVISSDKSTISVWISSKHFSQYTYLHVWVNKTFV